MSGQVYSVPFAQIPEWILDAEISDRAVRVFLVLHRYSNKDGHAFPGRAAMAERLGCSSNSLDRALNELREIGAVVSVQRKQGPAIVGNDYWLWPANPSPSVGMGSPTAEATPSPTAGATEAPRLARQEEREPSNESQSERESELVPVGTKSKRATRFPDEFFITDDMREWAAREVPSVDLRYETAKFADHFRGSGAPKKDWVAAWRNWMRKSAEWSKPRASAQRTRGDRNRQAISNVVAMVARTEQKALPL